MCGRYTLVAPGGRVAERFDATLAAEYRPRYNAAPGQSLPVVLDERPEAVTTATWGLRPAWAGTDGDGLINARAETLAEKPSFREPLERRRCLVPADGFYEWVDTDDGAGSQPYRVTFEDDRTFAMAGLWERWTPETTQTGLGDFGGDTAGSPADPDPDPVTTFTVVTVEPNPLVGELHHRMAAILPRDAERRWLEADTETARELLEPHPDTGMTAYPVSTAVNDPSNDHPGLLDPLSEAGSSPLEG